MNVLVVLVPCSLFLGLGALLAFLWTMRQGQYDDPEGDAWRVLLTDDGHLEPDDPPRE